MREFLLERREAVPSLGMMNSGIVNTAIEKSEVEVGGLG